MNPSPVMILQTFQLLGYRIGNVLFILFWAGLAVSVRAQELKLVKGVVLDQVKLYDTLPETVSLYLPSGFSPNKLNPLLCILGTGESVQSLRYFRGVAEENGYILVASKPDGDSVTLTQKVLHFSRVLEAVKAKLPINVNRITAGGFGEGGQLAALLPGLISDISGVLVLGAVPSDQWVKTATEWVTYVGFMGRGDFGYPDLQIVQSRYKRQKKYFFTAYFSGGHQRPSEKLLSFGFAALELDQIKAGKITFDLLQIEKRYQQYLELLSTLQKEGDWILVQHWLEQGITLFEGLLNTEVLELELKKLEKMPAYRQQKRAANAILYKEQITRSDLIFSMEEDLEILNFDNLGWWNFQIQEFQKLKKSSTTEESYYGSRMEDFTNALATDYINLLRQQEDSDTTRKIWLYMLKTLTEPKNPNAYFQVIGLSEHIGDTGTALYYLESLLKQGYADMDALYSIPNTALLRVGPDYNRVIQNYLGSCRYPALGSEGSAEKQN